MLLTGQQPHLPDLTWPKDSMWAVEKSPSWDLWGPVLLYPLTSSSFCSGWIAALSTLKQDLAVSIIMMVVAGFFTLCAVLSLFLLKRVSGGCQTNS